MKFDSTDVSIAGELQLNSELSDENEVISDGTVNSDEVSYDTLDFFYGINKDLLVQNSHNNLTGKAFNRKQIQIARSLFDLGMKADLRHGPLYHAYGNMEQVISAHTYISP